MNSEEEREPERQNNGPQLECSPWKNCTVKYADHEGTYTISTYSSVHAAFKINVEFYKTCINVQTKSNTVCSQAMLHPSIVVDI